MPDMPCIPCIPCMPCIGCEPASRTCRTSRPAPWERDPAAGTRAAGCAARADGCAARRQSWSVPVQAPAPVAPGLARHSRRSRAPRSPPALRPRARTARRGATIPGRCARLGSITLPGTVPAVAGCPAITVARRWRTVAGGRQVVVVVTLLVPHPLARTHHVAEVEGAGVGGKAHRCGQQAGGQKGAETWRHFLHGLLHCSRWLCRSGSDLPRLLIFGVPASAGHAR